MDFMPRQIFHREVERQCKFALMAYEDLKQALAITQQPAPPQPDITWNYTDMAQFQADMARHDQWLLARERYEQRRTAASDRFWYSLQAFLVAAGNISKLLWPPYRKGEALLPERGPELRASLEVAEDSPLAPPRTLRNHFEHFDTRLEQWASKPRVFADSNILRLGLVNGFEPTGYLRNFDTTNFAVTFQGESYALLPLVEAIKQLWHKASVQLEQRASA